MKQHLAIFMAKVLVKEKTDCNYTTKNRDTITTTFAIHPHMFSIYLIQHGWESLAELGLTPT